MCVPVHNKRKKLSIDRFCFLFEKTIQKNCLIWKEGKKDEKKYWCCYAFMMCVVVVLSLSFYHWTRPRQNEGQTAQRTNSGRLQSACIRILTNSRLCVRSWVVYSVAFARWTLAPLWSNLISDFQSISTFFF